MIDLHIHSNASDGVHTVESVVTELITKGVSHAALTDHDTVAGVEEFLGRTSVYGIHAVTGVEIAVEYDKNSTYHFLGYGIDILNSLLLEMLKAPIVGCGEAIKVIKQAGGYAVWAHPGAFCHINVIRLRLKEFIGYGLDGIEAFHHDHLPKTVDGCIELAQKYDLMITAGSDFHYKGSEQVGKINFHGYNAQLILSRTIEKIFGKALCAL